MYLSNILDSVNDTVAIEAINICRDLGQPIEMSHAYECMILQGKFNVEANSLMDDIDDEMAMESASTSVRSPEAIASQLRTASQKAINAKNADERRDALAEMEVLADDLAAAEKAEKDAAKKRKIKKAIAIGLTVVAAIAAAWGVKHYSKNIGELAKKILPGGQASENNVKPEDKNVSGMLKSGISKLKSLAGSGDKGGQKAVSQPAQSNQPKSQSTSTPTATTSSQSDSSKAPDKSSENTGLKVTYKDPKTGKTKSLNISGVSRNMSKEALSRVVKSSLSSLGSNVDMKNVTAKFYTVSGTL